MTTFEPSLKKLQDMYEAQCNIIQQLKEEHGNLFISDKDYSENSDRIREIKSTIEAKERKKIKLIQKMAEMTKDVPNGNLNQIKTEHLKEAVKSLNDAQELLTGPIFEYIQSYTEEEVKDDFEKSINALGDAWYHLNYALHGQDLSGYVLSKIQNASVYGKPIGSPESQPVEYVDAARLYADSMNSKGIIIEDPAIVMKTEEGEEVRILKPSTIDSILDLYRQNPEEYESRRIVIPPNPENNPSS